MTRAAEHVRARAGAEPVRLGLVLGSGLGALADEVEGHRFPFAELPGFPVSTVSGHAGALVVGRLEGLRVALASGRVHFYEGGGAAVMRPVLETMQALGATALLLTNSAGSTRAEFPPGSLVAIADHINLAGANPLVGVAGDRRFTDLVDAYSPALRARLRAVEPIPEGVYAWFSGPSFETPAEIRAARLLGADLVGMSTVPEVILARFLGLEVAAVSVVTNLAAGMTGAALGHEETKREAAKAAQRFRALVRGFVRSFAGEAAAPAAAAPAPADLRAAARRALACLDLTDLGEACTPADVARLCDRALTPAGPVAALCIWPRFVAEARRRLAGSGVRIATVVNFPAGTAPARSVAAEARAAIAEGADEIDAVIPWRRLAAGDARAVTRLVAAVKAASGDRPVKAILETGELGTPALVARAARAALAGGADFLKTSTGKVKVNATPGAVRILLEAARGAGRPVGVKPSGGVRTAEEAAAYLALADEVMGPGWARPETFRFGASGLLDALLAALAGRQAQPGTGY